MSAVPPRITHAMADALEQIAQALRVLPLEGPPPAEEWLSERDALALIGGDMSIRTLRRHTKDARFRKHISGRKVRYEKGGLLRWMRTR